MSPVVSLASLSPGSACLPRTVSRNFRLRALQNRKTTAYEPCSVAPRSLWSAPLTSQPVTPSYRNPEPHSTVPRQLSNSSPCTRKTWGAFLAPFGELVDGLPVICASETFNQISGLIRSIQMSQGGGMWVEDANRGTCPEPAVTKVTVPRKIKSCLTTKLPHSWITLVINKKMCSEFPLKKSFVSSSNERGLDDSPFELPGRKHLLQYC